MKRNISFKSVCSVFIIVAISIMLLNISLATEGEEAQKITEEPVTQESTQEEGTYYVSETSNLKLVPLINATNMLQVNESTKVQVTNNMNGWAYIEVEGTNTRGWIRKDALKSEAQKQAEDAERARQEAEAQRKAQEEADKTAPALKKLYVQKDVVNLRKENNQTSEVLKGLQKNTEVDVLAEDSEWDKCRVDGIVGYISKQYLSDKKVEEPTARSAKARSEVPEVPLKDIAASGQGSDVVSFAKSLVGCKYVHGGTTPERGFDCSGLTSYVYSRFGVSLPHSSSSQRNCGVAVDRSQLAPGDLVCYSGQVAIYIGGGQVVHASTPKTGVCITTIEKAKPGCLIGFRRVL